MLTTTNFVLPRDCRGFILVGYWGGDRPCYVPLQNFRPYWDGSLSKASYWEACERYCRKRQYLHPCSKWDDI